MLVRGSLACALVLASLASCRARDRREAGGVLVEERADVHVVRAGTLTATVTPPASTTPGSATVILSAWSARAPLGLQVAIDGVDQRIARRDVVTIDGTATIRHLLEGDRGELLVSVDPSVPALVVRARSRHGTALSLRASVTREPIDVVVEQGASWSAAEARPRLGSAYVVAGAAEPLVVTGSGRLEVEGGNGLALRVEHAKTSSDPAEVRLSFALARSTHDGLALGARLARVPNRVGTDLLIEVRDAETGLPVPARLWIESFPRIASGGKIILDPTRDAERTVPLIDVTAPRTIVTLPEGKHVVHATRGLGWSIVHREIELAAADVSRLILDLREETKLPEYVGCDFHVHARGSFDAMAVSYEERVRSLVAVGVECAAATEHDHVGDHGPTAKALGLDGRYRAVTGVELTTLGPGLGHFNVYPWPPGAKIPKTRGTTTKELFDAVHALPGTFVFQVNHPRMKSDGETSIGFFDLAGYDAKSGEAHGMYKYRADYDALEVFNGYELRDPAHVLRLVDEWIAMLDRGELHVATGSSDSHGISYPWAGFPRTLVDVGGDFRALGRPVERIVDAVKGGRAYVSSGPLLDVRVGDATLGGEAKGGSKLRIAVAKTSWLAAPRVTIRVGVDRLATVPVASSDGWIVELDTPKVTRRRPLVVIVEAAMEAEAARLFGTPHALAITNPIWLTP